MRINQTALLYIIWILKLAIGGFLIQTLVYKFGLSPDLLQESQVLFGQVSQYLFGTEKYEHIIRLSTGIQELIATILLLIPKTTIIGGIYIIALMMGAIFFHIVALGYDSLFFVAIAIALLAGCIIRCTYQKK